MELTVYWVRQDLAGWKNSSRNLYKKMDSMDIQAWMDVNPTHFAPYENAMTLQTALNNTSNPPNDLAQLFNFVKS